MRAKKQRSNSSNNATTGSSSSSTGMCAAWSCIVDRVFRSRLFAMCSPTILWLLANLIVLVIVFPHIIFGYIPVATYLAFQDATSAVQQMVSGDKNQQQQQQQHQGGGLITLRNWVLIGLSSMIDKIIKPVWIFLSKTSASVFQLWRNVRAFTLSGGSQIEDCNALGVTLTRYCFAGAPDPFKIAKEELEFTELFLPPWALTLGKMIRAVGSIRVFNTWLLHRMIPYIGRVNLIDQYFARYTIENKIHQIVLLGAGYDTRAYRYAHGRYDPYSSNTDNDDNTLIKVLEIDLPKVQERKLRVLKSNFSSTRFEAMTRYVEFMPCVLGDNEALFETLNKSQIDPTENTLVIMEGVSPYLPEKSFKKTIDTLRKFFTPIKHDENSVPASASGASVKKHLLLFDTMTTETMAECKKEPFYSWDRVIVSYGVGAVETTLSGDKARLMKELEALGLHFIDQHLWKDLIQIGLRADDKLEELQKLIESKMLFILDDRISMVQYILCDILPINTSAAAAPYAAA